MSYVLFDVGTNWGGDSLVKAANDRNIYFKNKVLK